MNMKVLIAIVIVIGLAVFGYLQLGADTSLDYAAKLGNPGKHSTSSRLPELPMHIEFDQANGRIVAKQENGAIVAWDIKSGTGTELAKTSELFGYCPGQQLLLVQETEGTFLIDLKSSQRQIVNEGTYHHAAWSTDCQTFALANQDENKLKRWRTADLSNHAVIPTGVPVRNGLAVSGDGSIIVAAEGTYSDDKGHATKLEVFVLDKDDNFSRRSPKNDGQTILGMWKMAITSDGRSLIVGSQKDGKSGLRALTTDTVGEKWRETGFQSHWVRAIAVSPDGKLIATGDEKGWLRIWNAENGVRLNEFQTGLVIQSLSFSADSKQLAAALWDSTIGIVDLKGF